MNRLAILMTGGAAGLVALPAYAHHPIGRELPDSILYGALSGIGHPLLGLTHLVFMFAVGILFALQPGTVAVRVLFFLAATGVGALMHVLGMDVPAVEQFIALGIVVAGVMLVWRQLAVLPCVLTLAGVAGLLHGFTYAEDIIGARTGPLMGYFLGFVLIQGAVLVATVIVARKLVGENAGSLLYGCERRAGAIVAGLGVLLLSI